MTETTNRAPVELGIATGSMAVELRELREENYRLRGERARQEAALAELRKDRDRERMDWLEDHCQNAAHRFLFSQCVGFPINKVRAAIDAAKEKNA